MFFNFIAAFALMLVLEGILPFASPRRYREFTQKISRMDNHALRRFGLVSMLVGAVVLACIHLWLYSKIS